MTAVPLPAEVLVRRARVEDAEAFAAVMSHPQVLGGLLQLPFNDAAEWRARLTDALKPGEPACCWWPRSMARSSAMPA